MAFTSYQLFLTGLMLITGTLNTLSTKWADRQEAYFCNATGNKTTFQHPFLQGVGMFIGEILCLLAFKFIWYSTAHYRVSKMTYKGNASSPIVQYWPIKINKEVHLTDGEQNFNPLILWIASLFDMTSTCLGYFALNYISASTFQMLRGSVMVFTAIFSILFLKRKLKLMHWLGILTVICGLIVVGVTDVIYPDPNEGDHTTGQKILGICLLLLGMVFTGLQMVYEERFVGKYNIPALQVVGWEGIFGFVTLGFLLIPFYYIKFEQSAAGPDHRLEDVPSAFCQMHNNPIIPVALIGNIFSIAFFNFAGVSVTKELSSTTRMVIDNGRTVVIWGVALALGWQQFHALQILGLALLIIGVGIYNGVWEHLYRRYVKGEKPLNEDSSLLPNYDDANEYTPTPGASNTPSAAGVYIAPEKGSVNG